MIRARFEVNDEDYRPVNWPIKHPYWCTGYGGDEEDGSNHAVIVAYADSKEEIMKNWPDAKNFSFVNEVSEYQFTDRFPKPEWIKN